MIKAGAQRVAAELGLALVAPDTSPRAARFAGDDEALGLRARRRASTSTRREAPWSAAYRMHSYVADELPALVERELPRRRRRALRSSATRWAATARWWRRCATPSASAASRRSRRSRRRARCRGDKRRSRAISGPIARRGREWDACALVAPAAASPARSSSTRARTTSSSTTSCSPSGCDAACAAAGQPLELRLRARLRSQLLDHRQLRRGAPRPPRARARPLARRAPLSLRCGAQGGRPMARRRSGRCTSTGREASCLSLVRSPPPCAGGPRHRLRRGAALRLSPDARHRGGRRARRPRRAGGGALSGAGGGAARRR